LARGKPDDHPGSECTQDTLESELGCDQHECRHQKQRQTHRQLGACTHGTAQQGERFGRPYTHPDGRRQADKSEENDQKAELLPGGVAI